MVNVQAAMYTKGSTALIAFIATIATIITTSLVVTVNAIIKMKMVRKVASKRQEQGQVLAGLDLWVEQGSKLGRA